jgi:4-hydroxybenzoate polyprenyltransferase
MALPPLVIFKGQTVQQQWFPPDLRPFRDWKFTATENGWTSDEVALEWLQKVFLPRTATRGQETRLLIFDGHGSHATNEFMYCCYEHNVQLLYLPPHTSHVLQPLDLAIFGPLKHAYRTYVDNFNLYTNSAPVGRQNLLKGYCHARTKAITASNIKAGWEVTGLWPVAPARPLASRLLLKNSNTSQDALEEAQDDVPTPIPTISLPSRPRKSLMAIDTPKRATDLKRAFNTMENGCDINARKSRHLIRKITKGFDEKDYTIAMQADRIRALEAQIEGLKPKRRKKVKLSPNSKFASINAIRKAQIEAGVVGDSLTDDSEASEEDLEDVTAEGSCIEVAI